MPNTPKSRAPGAPTETTAKRTPDYGQPAVQLFEKCRERAENNSARKARDRADWWNLKVYRGGSNAWDVWDKATQRFVERGTDPALGGIPAYVPRANTNVFAVKIDGIAAILDQTDPAKQCGPASPDDADRAAAEVAEQALPALFEEIGYELDRAQIHKLITLTSRVGYAIYCDNDPKYGTDKVAMQQCRDCGAFAMPADTFGGGAGERGPTDEPALTGELEADVDVDEQLSVPTGDVDRGGCPECGSLNIGDAIDPRLGQPIAIDYPKGKLCAKLVHNFELSTPPGSRTTDTARLPWVLTHTRLPYEEVYRRWPDLRGQLDESGTTRGTAPGSTYADGMAGLVAPNGDGGVGGGAAMGPVVYELWHDPIEAPDAYFPRGLYLVRVDDQTAEAGPLQYEDEDGRPIKNILIRQFAEAPGTDQGKPPGDDLASLQVTRNLVESMHDLSLLHFAAPREYIPLSVTLETESTGAPGERIHYRSHVPGEKPSIEQGTPPSAALQQRLDAIDKKFDELSRLNAVLAGERPEGEPTLGEIQILREQGQSSFRAPIDALVQFETALARLTLRLAAQTGWAPRFYKIRGDNGGWEVKQFLGADLAGKVDIYIDKASAWPKSPMLHALRLKEAFNIGLLPSPAAADPELAAKLLEEMDLASLKPTLDRDRKQIARELDVWKTAMDPAEILPPDPLVQTIPFHFALKQAWMKTEEAEQAKFDRPEVYAAMRAHLEQLQLLMMPPAPAGPAAPGAALDGMVSAGVLKPSGPQGADVGSLVAGQVLKPAPAPQETTR